MRWLVWVAVVGGCYRPDPPAGSPCAVDTDCPSPYSCIDGACGATVDADESTADACTFVCVAGTLVGCGEERVCDRGCVDAPTAHCARIRPSNGVSWDLVPVPGGALVLGPGAHVFDTTTGILTTGGIEVPLPERVATTLFDPGTGSVRVLAARSLAVEGTLTVVGMPPLVILIDGDATISGELRAAGGCAGAPMFDPSCGGPGGGKGQSDAVAAALGCGPGLVGYFNQFGSYEAGGGGGGYGQSGRDSNGNSPGDGAGGRSCGMAELVPLVGGRGGGAGGIDMVMQSRTGGRGGGGGGAIQLTVSGKLEVSGRIDAGGAGGEDGHWNGQQLGNGGGGGGGSGGGLLLEAGSLAITGSVTANGGAGGGNDSGAGGDGESGRFDRTCANGGTADFGHSPGGRGGCAQGGPMSGGTTQDRGGGGGGTGRIRFNQVGAPSPGGIISPPESRGMPVVE
ncbi:MAG TPA: hypothetical protein VIU61_15800 [Kofleriaceae bacterium]